MSEAKVLLPVLGSTEWGLLWAVLLSSLVALAYGWYLVRHVLAADPGPPAMVAVAAAVEEGAMAYLARQVKTMILFVAVISVGLWALYARLYASQAPSAWRSERSASRSSRPC